MSDATTNPAPISTLSRKLLNMADELGEARQGINAAWDLAVNSSEGDARSVAWILDKASGYLGSARDLLEEARELVNAPGQLAQLEELAAAKARADALAEAVALGDPFPHMAQTAVTDAAVNNAVWVLVRCWRGPLLDNALKALGFVRTPAAS